jgi:asparagine N-glycosylation enzyme membrane subunit Stt3
MDSSTRTNISFFVPVVLALGVFAAIVLPGEMDGLRFAFASAAFLVIAPGGAWMLGRLLQK